MTEEKTDALILGPGEGEKISVGPSQVTFKLDAKQTGGAFSMIEFSVAPSFEAPSTLHYHTNESWAAYILEGTFGFQLGTETVIAEAGTVLFVPKGLPFKWWNNADRPAKYLAIYFPAGFEKYFIEVNEATKDLPPGPLDMSVVIQRIRPLWEKYGIAIKRETEE